MVPGLWIESKCAGADAAAVSGRKCVGHGCQVFWCLSDCLSEPKRTFQSVRDSPVGWCVHQMEVIKSEPLTLSKIGPDVIAAVRY